MVSPTGVGRWRQGRCHLSDLISLQVSLPLLDRVNCAVNDRVLWVSDQDRLGQAEYWEVLKDFGAGDCEDFVLTKRHFLTELGLPAAALLVATGWLRNGDRHAVALVDSYDYGLQVLDSLTDDILPWNDCRIARWHGYSVPHERIWRKLQPA